MPRINYTLAEEPRGLAYRELLDLGLRTCARGLLVCRDREALSADGGALLARLQAHKLEVDERAAWPGTELFIGTAEIFTFDLADDVVDLLGSPPGLYGWLEPWLPEDLCLLRPDGSAWLTTIAHEGDAFLSLSPAERIEVEARAPLLSRLLRADDPA